MSLKACVEGAIPDLTTMTDRASNGTVVFLDRKLTNSEAGVNDEVKHVLIEILKEAIIEINHEYFYKVDFGPGVYPQHHIVSHDLFCTCTLEADCPAVTAVRVYLQRRIGETASTPSPGYFPAAPHYCPVCGARAYYEPSLSSHHRGIGWHCSNYGAAHYWQHQGIALRAAYAEKWKRLGIDPETFKVGPVFPFKDGYDPERDPESLCSNHMPVAP